MGVHGLWQLLRPAGKPIALETLEGKILAIDVSIWMNKAAKGMRDKYGNPIHNAHLIVIFHRICKLLFYKVKPIFVFDGGVPELKKKTIAARRERKIVAEGKAQKTSKKILHNFIKGKALESVTGKKGPRQVNASKQEGQDIFELPPLPVSNQLESSSESEDNVDAETEWMASMKSENVEKMFEEIGSVDMDAEDFKDLPAEIQHELLMEMKDSYRRRYNRRKSQQMPEEAHDFSDFQLKNLFRRGKITKKIEDVRKQMKSKTSGDVGELEEGSYFEKKLEKIEANRVASEDKQHYILLKKEEKKGQNILFNTSLETEHLDIYEGVKRKDNFDRLEREPAHFKRSYIDGLDAVSFMSDSAEESDFDKDFTLCDAEKFTICQRARVEGHELNLVRLADREMQGESNQANQIDERLRDHESKVINLTDDRHDSIADAESFVWEKTENRSEQREIMLVSSEESGNESVDFDKCSKSSRKRDFLDLENMSKNTEPLVTAKETSEATTFSGHLDEGHSQEKEIGSPSVVTFGDSPADNQILKKTNEEPMVISETEETLSNEANIPITSIVEEQPLGLGSETSDLKASMHSKDTVDSEERLGDEKLVSEGIDGDISAVPKSDVIRNDTMEEILDSNELQTFKTTVRECQSAEEVIEIQDSLIQEQGNLLIERDRQSRAAASVGNEEYNDVQELLQLFGIPFIVSPMEAEAQCATLDVTGQTDGSITDDSDILLFGGRRVYKNVFNQDKYAELFTIENVNHALYLNREKMIGLAYLTGSDYTEGIYGVGVITAMEILQEFGGEAMQALVRLKNWFEEVKSGDEIDIFEKGTKLKNKLRTLELPRSFPNRQVWDAYINPTVDQSAEPFEWGKPDLAALREFARAKFGWRTSRTDEILLPVLKELNAKQNQTNLRRYFTEVQQGSNRKVASKRLQRTVNLMRAGVSGTTDKEEMRAESPKTARKDAEDSQPKNVPSPGTEVDKSASNKPARGILKNDSYRRKRMPSRRDFQKRVAKSVASGRGQRKKRQLIVRSNQIRGKNEIARNVLDLSGSSSDSEDWPEFSDL